ncbi:MAG TPA: nucleotidyl transferase AbiEii/AbiGii toxin family protein [Candidatus Absconditabacterales bacterium]|nr:nucleotidyl transferase AbiEii/AbiGii toxin family protein [Candidatus Absconditabacterales bacterium]
MINLNNIIQQYPPKLHNFPKAILREYLQYKILASIFSSPLSKKLCFIGGTALRIGHNSQRFSEDIDFDNRGLTVEEFEKLTKVVEQELLLEGYEVEIKHVYKGAFHCSIKIPKLLFDNNLASMVTEKLVIKIDTTPQGYNYSHDTFVLQKFGIVAPYKMVPKDILLSMKFSAFFSRAKGRDLFDIVYLLGMGVKPNWGFCKHSFGIDNGKSLKIAIKKRLNELDLIALQKDVQPFLFDSNDKSVELFDKIIEQTDFK